MSMSQAANMILSDRLPPVSDGHDVRPVACSEILFRQEHSNGEAQKTSDTMHLSRLAAHRVAGAKAKHLHAG